MKETAQDDDCADVVVTFECFNSGLGDYSNEMSCGFCADDKCSNVDEDIFTFADGTQFKFYGGNEVIEDGADFDAGENYACRMTASGQYAKNIERFYFMSKKYYECKTGQACLIPSNTDYSQAFEIEYTDPITKETKRRILNKWNKYNKLKDFAYIVKLKKNENSELEPVYQNVYEETCKTNEFLKRNIPETELCSEYKTCKDYQKNLIGPNENCGAGYGKALSDYVSKEGQCYECRQMTITLDTMNCIADNKYIGEVALDVAYKDDTGTIAKATIRQEGSAGPAVATEKEITIPYSNEYYMLAGVRKYSMDEARIYTMDVSKLGSSEVVSFKPSQVSSCCSYSDTHVSYTCKEENGEGSYQGTSMSMSGGFNVFHIKIKPSSTTTALRVSPHCTVKDGKCYYGCSGGSLHCNYY